MKIFKTISFEETVELGEKLGLLMNGGDIVYLDGDLGAGKTAFVNGIAKALGINSYITSPTFTIVNEYSGKYKLYHFDIYRLGDMEELYEIGFDDYLQDEAIIVIEWAKIFKNDLPKEYIAINIEKIEDYNSRNIEMTFIGDRYRNYEKLLTEEL